MKFVVKSTVDKGIHQLSQKQEAIHPRALKAVGLQLLNNVVNGSPGASVVPPIKTGVLRSSGSVFVGSKLVGTSPMIYGGTPATAHSAPDNQITIVFNTAYAARMHEDNWTPGKGSRDDGKDVGNQFLKKHIDGDWQELQRLYANILKKDLFQGGLKE